MQERVGLRKLIETNRLPAAVIVVSLHLVACATPGGAVPNSRSYEGHPGFSRTALEEWSRAHKAGKTDCKPGPPPPFEKARARAKVGRLRARGLSKREIGTAIKARLALLHACADDEIWSGNEIDGRVKVRFVIDAAGRVTRAEIGESTTPSARLALCTLRLICETKFRERRGREVTIVGYPFVFKAKELDER